MAILIPLIRSFRDSIEKATALIVSLKHSEDPLVFQAKAFIETTLMMLVVLRFR